MRAGADRSPGKLAQLDPVEQAGTEEIDAQRAALVWGVAGAISGFALGGENR